MAVDRSIRFLTALGGASTSRVLNLCQIAADNVGNPEHAQHPLFTSPVINRAFLLKHRPRGDEAYLFAAAPPVATKIILPFDHDDLRAGGRSFFIGQRGFEEALRSAGSYRSETIERDRHVLALLDKVPSLDPFLLREYLRDNDVDVAPCYFSISVGDQQRMHRFVSRELSQLIRLANGGRASDRDTSRLVGALLSTWVDERLDPLRHTLGLTGEDFREGIFSWRGFLYYKWTMSCCWPDMMEVLHQISRAQPDGRALPEQRALLTAARRNIISLVRDNGEMVERSLSVYNESFADLVANRSPRTFRDFLLTAPFMFLELGERLAGISHIVSFWRYRFPARGAAPVDAEELAAIFQDFCSGFGEKPHRAGWLLARRHGGGAHRPISRPSMA